MRHPACTSLATSSSSARSTTRRNCHHTSGIGWSPVGRPVFAATNRAAWAALTADRTPLLVAFSDGDPITGAMAPILRTAFAGARGRDHPVIAGAGHFLQEDAGQDLARHVLAFVRTT